MATSREYELLFMLKAQIDSAFGTGFSRAEQYMAQLQTEQRQLNAALRDVAAYQRQQQALDTLKAKLAEEKKALEDARQSTKANADETTRLASAKEKHQATIRTLDEQLKLERKALEETKGKIEAEGQETAELTAEKEKHERAIQELTEKKKQEQEALKDVNQQLRDNKSESKQLTAEEEKHKQSVDRLNDQVTKQERKIFDTIQALKRQGVETTELEQEERRLREALGITTRAEAEGTQETRRLADAEDELRSKLEAVRQEQQKWTETVNQITDVANTLNAIKPAADTVANAVKGMDEAIMRCIEGAGELQFTMSGVRAVSGATAEETQQLTDAAKYMGATTIYTASECAEALQTQALAGWDVQEMLNGLPAVVQLAAASQEDLTTMTGIVSDSLNAFGLSGSEAVNRFADTLAKAATSSNTTVSLLGQSLSYVESTAANLDYSIEDVSIALAVMANNALKGGVSGSALNTMLTRMSGANKTAKDEMDRLNLSMYDADGAAKELLPFLNELRDKFRDGSMTAQEMQISAFKLAGQRGMRGLLSIVNTSDEEWQKMTEDIYSAKGAVEEMSDVRLDNYRGQIYLMESAHDALNTTIGETFIPTATWAASVMTDLYTGANDIVSKNPELVTAITVAGNAFGLMGKGVSAAATAATALRSALTILGPEAAAMAGPVLLAAGGVAAAIGIIAGALAYEANLDYTSESVRKLKEETDALIETNKKKIEQYDQEIAGYEEERDKALELASVLENLIGKKQDAWSAYQIKDVVDELNEAVPSLNLDFDVSNGSLNKSMGEITGAIKGDSASKELEPRRNKLTELMRQQEEDREAYAVSRDAYVEAKKEWDQVVEESAKDENYDLYSKKVQTIRADYEATKAAMESSKSAYQNTTKKIEEQKGAIELMLHARMQEQGVTDISTDQYNEMSSAVDQLRADYGEAYKAADKLVEGIYGLGKSAQEIDKEITLDSMTKSLREQREQVKDYTKDLETIVEKAQEGNIDISNIVGSLTDGSGDAIAMAKQLADGGVESIRNVAKEADKLESAKDKLKNLFTLEDGTVQADVINLSDMIQFDDAGLAQKAQNALNTMLDGLPGVADRVSSIGADVSQGLANGMSDTSGVDAAGNALGQSAVESVAAGAQTHSPSKATTQTGMDIDQGLVSGMQLKEAVVAAKSAEVGRRAVQSFKTAMPQSTFSAHTSSAMQAAINGINSKRGALVAAARAAGKAASAAFKQSSAKVPGYAVGTRSAAPGLALTAENGPEIVKDTSGIVSLVGLNGPQLVPMSGGETVYTAQETQKILNSMAPEEQVYRESVGAAGTQTTTAAMNQPVGVITAQNQSTSERTVIQLTYAPVIHTSGGDNQSIHAQLEEHDAELLDKIETLMDEREAAQARRAY